MFDPEVFKMKDGVLMFTKAANKNPNRPTGVYGERSIESLSSE